MKAKLSLSRFCLLCVFAFCLPARPQAVGDKAPPQLVTNPPAHGTFYRLSQERPVPYPYDFSQGTLPLFFFDGVFFLDDRDYVSLRSQEWGEGGGMMSISGPSLPPSAGGTNSTTNLFCNSLTNFMVGYLYATNGLALGIAPTTNPWIALTMLTTTTNASYDVFGTTNMAELALPSLSRTNWTWLMRANGRATNFAWGQTNWCERYFQLGDLTDPDNDGLSTAYEQLSSHTSPTNADSPRAIYEGILSNQSPSAWFKLNDTNLADAQGGPSLTIAGGAWDADAFAIGNSAFSFTASSHGLTSGDVINGGTGTNQGSMSLLFRSIEGFSSNTVRYVFYQNNDFGAFFEPTNTSSGSPGSLKVHVGGQTNAILLSNDLVFGAWYHLTMTWNETNDVAPEVNWYLGRVGGTLNFGTMDLTNNRVVGSNTTVYLGNNNGANRALRGPGFGALDEIVFWNRELTGPEVNAQFDTLKVLFQGPAKVFDLSRWNLLLPVDKLNQLNSNNAPLKITWLNSGFKYVDPTNWTQKYFYLSTSNMMVFDAPWNGADTDTTGNSARSELRETKPDGSDRNWLPLGTNILEATCAVNSAGANNQAKVIIGQIHSDIASDPPVVISYNFPDPNRVGKVTVTVKDNPTGSADRNFTLATNVSPNAPIDYKLELVGTTNSVVLRAMVNGAPIEVTMYENGDPIRTNANWKATTFYFKAGAYYPKATNSGTAKVTFSRLVVTPQP
jgi:Alginate lyase/Concanavalin A-like lectin/glucanases superfamily